MTSHAQNTTTVGRAIWQTLENMRALDRDIPALWNDILEALKKIDGIDHIDEIGKSSREHPNGWAFISEYGVYALRIGRRNARPLGAVTIQIELGREAAGTPWWQHAREPIVYVGFEPDAGDAWDGVGLGIDADGQPVGGEYITLAEPMLWEWDRDRSSPRPWAERSWFYCVPLAAIEDRDRIRHEITGPLEALLQGKAPEQAFLGTSVVRFEASNATQ